MARAINNLSILAGCIIGLLVGIHYALKVYPLFLSNFIQDLTGLFGESIGEFLGVVFAGIASLGVGLISFVIAGLIVYGLGLVSAFIIGAITGASSVAFSGSE